MKIPLIISISLFFSGLAGAETILLRSGAELDAKVVSLDGGTVSLDGGKALKRRDVSEIQFAGTAAGKQEAAAEASPEDMKTAKAAFARAQALARKYPGMNGLVLLDSGSNTLNPDGTTVYRNHQVRQILKESVKQAWGQVIACAEEGRDRVKILKASVYGPDGTISTLDPSKIKTSKPQEEGGDFFVSGSVCTQYVMPNVQVGSIVDYETETVTFNPFRKDFFFPTWGFQDDQGPVARSEIAVTVPESTTFYYSVKNFSGLGDDKPAVSSAGGMKTYAWALENVPPLVDEPYMPSYEDVAPFMRGSIFKEWDRVFDWTRAMHDERTKPSPELVKFTLDLVKDSRTEEQKAAKIYHYVQKEIRYIAVKVGVASGWGGYDANLTWKRRYGCCIDKSLLLTTMLKVAGIKASPILLNTNNMNEIDYSIPQLGFDHAITVAEIGGRHVFLDSTNFDYRYPEIASFDYGVHVLNIFANKIDYIPVPAPSDNGSYYDFTVNLSSSGAAEIAERMHYTGSREGGLRSYYRSIKKEEQKRAFQSFAKSVAPSAELLSYEVNNAEKIEEPFTLATKYYVPDYPQRAGNILIVKIPDFELEQYRIREISLDKRRYPIEYEDSMGRYQNYTILVPANFEIVSFPGKIDLANKYASFRSECSKGAGNSINCKVSWERKERIIPAQDYALYKAFIEKAASYTKGQVFLRDLSSKGK